MTKAWKRGFEAARIASKASDGELLGECVGAALFAGKRLLSIGFNTYKQTHTRAKHSIHAEHRAIIRRQHYDGIENMTMYVYRERTKPGWRNLVEPACSRPCATCQVRLQKYGVKRVRYITEDGKPAEMVFRRQLPY